MSFELREGSCFHRVLVGVNVGLALVDGVLAILAFSQLIRIHSRNLQHSWTRQKVFHLMIGSSNFGYLVYFVLTLIAACNGWQCWSHSCGFIFMAFPKILFFAAFLLLLSFWIYVVFPIRYMLLLGVLIHDHMLLADDEDEEDEDSSFHESLLEKTFNEPSSSNTDNHRRCLPFRLVHVGSRQRIVVLVTSIIFVIMMACAVAIWIGIGKNSIDSAVVARVYVDLFAIAMLLLGGALAYYGLILCLKMSKVRSERASSELWKVAGLTVVSVLCFTSSSLVALLTNIPMLYHWHKQHMNDVCTSLLLILYYFVGTSVPSAFVLWVMREVPPSITTNVQEESTTLAFVTDTSAAIQEHPQPWTTVTSLHNQISRASPI